jgi:glycosyltransferase involved in cell wall biosynthesis
MKVSGFTIARNIVKADYPIREALFSIAPLCDEIIVAVGNSDDGTQNVIEELPIPQLKIIPTVWDDNLRTGGRVLSDETNKALKETDPSSTWCFYIQADECIHEKDYQKITMAMEAYKDDPKVEGLLFHYVHFYGTYDYIGDSRRWYSKEIRIIKQGLGIKSWKDAQGFRSFDNKKLRVKQIDATIYHYGWVKHPEKQQQKQKQFHRLWHNDSKLKSIIQPSEVFDYSSIDSLKPFQGNHPQVMKNRIESVNWNFEGNPNKKKFTPKTWFLYWFEKIFGVRIGEYKNYIKI